MAFPPGAPGASGKALAVTPSDTTVFASPTSGLYVGGAGNVAVLMANDTVPVTLTAPVVGQVLPISVTKVMATNTTATLIVVLF